MKYIKTFEGVVDMGPPEPWPKIKDGDKVLVTFNMFEGSPSYEVTAYRGSDNSPGKFTFLQGGDMMMFAIWDGKKWVAK